MSEENLYGGVTSNSYSYDNRYQLVNAEGSFIGNDKEHKYTMAMEYGATGKILRKIQSNQYRKKESDWLTDATTSMDYTYSYNGQKPHAVSSIVDNETETLFTYTYDASGNNLLETNNKASSDREIVWTEDNRLAAIKARGNVSHYVYDANGIRTLKMNSSGFNISINGVAAGTEGIDGNFTIYANPYAVVRKNQYTKHYFLGTQRILTKIGNSEVEKTFFEGYAENIVPNVDYQGKQDDLENKFVLNNELLNVGWYRETRGRIPSQHIKHYLRSKEYGGLSGVNPWQDGTETTDKTATYEEKQYFFHPDHLGSSNYLTDVLGEAYQHIEYLPWGEVFVEERNTQTSRNTFLYTGKELDEETGLYYYEQRYYDPGKSYFLGVDQLLDEYLNKTPFHFVSNNPLNRVDPDGRDDYFNESGKFLGRDDANTEMIRVISQELWDINKETSNDGVESIVNDVAKSISSFHSEADISNESSLNIYNHYNPTDLELFENDKAVMTFTGKSIKINIEGNKKPKTRDNIIIADDSNIIKNVFSHEKQHYQDFKDLGLKKYLSLSKEHREGRAYKTQMNDPTWRKVPESLQNAIKSSATLRYKILFKIEKNNK